MVAVAMAWADSTRWVDSAAFAVTVPRAWAIRDEMAPWVRAPAASIDAVAF